MGSKVLCRDGGILPSSFLHSLLKTSRRPFSSCFPPTTGCVGRGRGGKGERGALASKLLQETWESTRWDNGRENVYWGYEGIMKKGKWKLLSHIGHVCGVGRCNWNTRTIKGTIFKEHFLGGI